MTSADFGDLRLNKRFQTLASQLTNKPSQPINQIKPHILLYTLNFIGRSNYYLLTPHPTDQCHLTPNI